MRQCIRGMRPATLLGVALVAVMVVGPEAGAQGGGKGFLFGAPNWSLTLFGGLAVPSASSDVFQQATKNLTLSRGDFNAPALGAELQFPVTPQFELSVGVSYATSNKKSEFRDWVDNNNRPIEQFTGLQRVPVTASVKYYLSAPGRSVGRLAWIPAKFAPFIGVGGGTMWYRYTQNGDFIDFATKNVFSDTFKSTGWAGSAHLLAGFDYSLSPRYALTTEARYTRASNDMGSDFSGFNRIDLSGVATTVGVRIRF